MPKHRCMRQMLKEGIFKVVWLVFTLLIQCTFPSHNSGMVVKPINGNLAE